MGEEFTSGRPDEKEGIYFGRELLNEDSRPLHGANLWPDGDIGREMVRAVIEYMTHMERIGQKILELIVSSLDLSLSEFQTDFKDPTVLFRIFNYPPHDDKLADSHGVGEHTDYGFITILYQDTSGGLQIKNKNGTWINVDPIVGTFVVNLGDALEHMTGGLLRATPHRVIQRLGATKSRLSFPFFFDPNFDSPMRSVVQYLSPELQAIATANRGDVDYATKKRWDSYDPASFSGTYGRYLMMKVSKVFPDLAQGYLKKTENKVGMY